MGEKVKKYVEGIRKEVKKRASKAGYSSVEGVVTSKGKIKGMEDE